MTAASNRKLRLIEKIVQIKDEKAPDQMEDILDSLEQAVLPYSITAGEIEALKQGRADRAAGRVVSHGAFMQALDEGLA